MYLIEKLLVLISILKMFPNSCPELIKSFLHKPNKLCVSKIMIFVFLNSFDLVVCVIEIQCVSSAVKIDCLNIIQINFRFQRVNLLWRMW
jgi:hypothetical protein